jgi:hypothetical protein
VNETRGKTDIEWANLIRKAMAECYRALKPGHWISLCYHDTSEGTWQMIQDIMAEVGFIPEISLNTLFIDTEQKSYNQVTAEKVTKRDLVINFRKPRLAELNPHLILTGEEDPATFAEKGRAILIEALEAHPGATTDRLYDELVSRMVRKGEFQRHNFDQLLRSVAEESNGAGTCWTLPGRLTRMKAKKKRIRLPNLKPLCRNILRNTPMNQVCITRICLRSTFRSRISRGV